MTVSGTTKRKKRSALWLAIHGWLGLPIWAFMFFICLTGSIATISQEIVWVFDPAARSNPPSDDASYLPYAEIMARIEKQAPGTAVMYIGVPVKKQYALQFYVGQPNGTEKTIYVNPYTGAIQGEKSTFDLPQLLRELHGWLLIPFTANYSPGWYIVSAMSIPLLGSLISGLVVYKKFWRAFLRPRLRLNQGARAFWGDFHRLAGLWSIPFICIMSITAFWFLIEACLYDTGYKVPGEIEHPHVPRNQVQTGPNRQAVQTISLDRAIEIARGNFPDLEPAYIEMPLSAYDPIEIAGRGAYPLLFELAYINPYSGKVMAARGIQHRTAVAFVTESMRPLHTGDFAGLWLKFLYFFCGLLLTTLSLSGMMIWAKRSVQATSELFSRKQRLAPLPQAAE
ncbi:MAG: PepSY-associated TM helix domain-containing protein [Mesorhizobium sp.]